MLLIRQMANKLSLNTVPVQKVLSSSKLKALTGKQPLYTADQVPRHFRERCIHKGYRNPRSSPIQCALSIFMATNETLNFWTHFLPFWYFLWKMLALNSSIDFFGDPKSWPFLAFMLTVCVYPIVSSVAHTFSSMSEESRHICFFLDYSAVSLYSLGSAIAYRAYALPAAMMQSPWAVSFVYVAIVNGAACTAMACYSRLASDARARKGLRLAAFVFPYLFDTAPLVYRLVAERADMDSWPMHVRHIALASMTGALYGSHFPECLIPGKFDYIGNSHQLFHVMGAMATTEQIHALLVDYQQRHDVYDAPLITFTWSLGAVLCLALLNLAVICLFAAHIYRRKAVSITSHSGSASTVIGPRPSPTRLVQADQF